MLRFRMEWPSPARQRTDEPSSPRERAPPPVLFRALLSLSISLALSWQFETATLTLVLICASAHGTSPQAFPAQVRIPQRRRKTGEVRSTWSLAPPHVRENNEKKGKYGKSDMPCHWYLPGWQEHRLLHLDQSMSPALGARNAPLQEYCLCLRYSIPILVKSLRYSTVYGGAVTSVTYL